MQAKRIALGILAVTLALAAAGCSSRPAGQEKEGAAGQPTAGAQTSPEAPGDKGAAEKGQAGEPGADMGNMDMQGRGDMGGGKDMQGMGGMGGHNERTYDVPPDAPKTQVSMKNMRFNPSEFKLKAGEPVRFAIANEDSVAHDFMLDGENGFDTGVLQPGDKKEIGWIPEKPGTYEAYCSQPGHKQLGMTARIVVE